MKEIKVRITKSVWPYERILKVGDTAYIVGYALGKLYSNKPETYCIIVYNNHLYDIPIWAVEVITDIGDVVKVKEKVNYPKKPLTGGFIKKGGVSKMPTAPKPDIKPIGQKPD